MCAVLHNKVNLTFVDLFTSRHPKIKKGKVEPFWLHGAGRLAVWLARTSTGNDDARVSNFFKKMGERNQSQPTVTDCRLQINKRTMTFECLDSLVFFYFLRKYSRYVAFFFFL